MVERAQALFVDVMERAGVTLVRFDGVLDETAELDQQLASVSNRKVLFHLARVDGIRSAGVRDWIRWVQGLEARGNSLFFVQCSPPVVVQVNRLTNFCGEHGQVVSFEAPYYCTSCHREQREALFSAHLNAPAAVPTAFCERCGDALEFDDLVDGYFQFLRVHGGRTVDPEVEQAMHKFEDAHLATKIAELKEISSGGSRTVSTPRPSPSAAPKSAAER